MQSERGFTLIEVLVSLALIAVVAVGYLGAMVTSTKGAETTRQIDVSRALAEGQMEYIKHQPFATSYTPDPSMVNGNNQFTDYPGYSVSITVTNAAQRDANIQKITVAIAQNGINTTTLSDCKVN